ncbi:hypothetical protein SAMN05216511_4776 [Streptomyces sp. KS_16]|nr:hypothetical protein BX261_2428 [Streptomyces sp. 2321.6]SDR49110.1 hypothetical protein SAMN05216511_4776 [Streptomyces sp. KS_16]SEC61483.1 hypothetical protein SAMN05428940_2431 [Streptomyces sp. 2133.1]SNC68584.1 hypothetical protein SAMN06272741_2425 [Streptomyces sp. 2114.4]
MLGCGQPRRSLQPFCGLGTYDIHHTALAQLTPRRFGGTGAHRRMLKSHTPKPGLVHRNRLRVVQRAKRGAQGTHRSLVTGAHGFGQCLTHTMT